MTIDQTGRPQVFISPAHLDEALRIDGTVLDEHSFFPMTIAEKYTFGGYGQPIGINGQHVVCIRGLTRNMHRLSEDLSDETEYALGKYWGHESQWKEVKLVETCKFLTGAVTSRMLVGLPLCKSLRFISWIKLKLIWYRPERRISRCIPQVEQQPHAYCWAYQPLS